MERQIGGVVANQGDAAVTEGAQFGGLATMPKVSQQELTEHYRELDAAIKRCEAQLGGKAPEGVINTLYQQFRWYHDTLCAVFQPLWDGAPPGPKPGEVTGQQARGPTYGT